MTTASFEKQRLQLFARHGFDGQGRRIVDRTGRMTAMLVRGEGEPSTSSGCPFVEAGDTASGVEGR